MYRKIGEKCDFQRSFEPCYEALDARAPTCSRLSQSWRKLGYAGLARQTEEFIATLEARRTLLNPRKRCTRTCRKRPCFARKNPATFW